jgi:hypothetical protein
MARETPRFAEGYAEARGFAGQAQNNAKNYMTQQACLLLE